MHSTFYFSRSRKAFFFMMTYFAAPIFIGVVTLLAVVSAQEATCGCAPQPTIIQLSCGGGGRGGPPRPPPAGGNWGMGPGSGGMEHEPTNPEEVMNMCQFDENGYPTSHPPGGFPEGFRILQDEHGNPLPIAPAGFPVPPMNWDGRMETLGFKMPQPGTPHYNMFLCYPMPVVTI